MAIAPEAIDRYLTAALPHVPDFKGIDPRILHQRIIDVSGKPLACKTDPRPHQLEGVAFALYMQRCLLFYWMRLGKTKIALDWMNQLIVCNLTRGKGLVIAHSPVGAQVWETEIPKHSDLRATVVASGATSSDDLVTALESDCHVIVMAHSTMQQLFAEKYIMPRKKIPKLRPDYAALSLAASYFSFAVIDEAHLCANPGSLRFAICDAIMANCKHRIGLTGTPFGRNPYAIWSQAYLVDQGLTFGKSYHFFEYAYGKQRPTRFGKRRIETIFDKKKLPALKQKLDTLALAYGKNEIKGAQVFAGTVELRMGLEQREAYNKLLQQTAELREADVEQATANFARLRQIASGYLRFNDSQGKLRTINFPHSAKLTWLADLLENFPEETQCIIFHEYTHSGELICKTLTAAQRTHAWLHGGTSDKRAVRELFMSGAAQFLVANTVVGGTAIDLPMADYLIFFESPCSPRVREQAAARPMARGDRPLVLDDLICAPVERNILRFIQEGRDLSRQLLGDRAKILRDWVAR